MVSPLEASQATASPSPTDPAAGGTSGLQNLFAVAMSNSGGGGSTLAEAMALAQTGGLNTPFEGLLAASAEQPTGRGYLDNLSTLPQMEQAAHMTTCGQFMPVCAALTKLEPLIERWTPALARQAGSLGEEAVFAATGLSKYTEGVESALGTALLEAPG